MSHLQRHPNRLTAHHVYVVVSRNDLNGSRTAF